MAWHNLAKSFYVLDIFFSFCPPEYGTRHKEFVFLTWPATHPSARPSAGPAHQSRYCTGRAIPGKHITQLLIGDHQEMKWRFPRIQHHSVFR